MQGNEKREDENCMVERRKSWTYHLSPPILSVFNFIIYLPDTSSSSSNSNSSSSSDGNKYRRRMHMSDSGHIRQKGGNGETKLKREEGRDRWYDWGKRRLVQGLV